MRLGGEGEIDLQDAGKQEDAVDGRVNGKVEEHCRIKVGRNALRACRKNRLHRHPIRDPERQIEVGSAVTSAGG